MSGETPFFRLFGRPMPTKLSHVVQEIPVSPTYRKRSAEKEYRKRWHSSKAYSPGDLVLVRKGDSQPFLHKGIVTRQVARYTYEIDLGHYKRIYNQRHMKSLSLPNTHWKDYRSADEAYDAIESGVTDPIVTSEDRGQRQLPGRRSTRSRHPVERYGVRSY